MIKRLLKSFWLWIAQDPDAATPPAGLGDGVLTGAAARHTTFPSQVIPVTGVVNAFIVADEAVSSSSTAVYAAPQEALPMSLTSILSTLLAKAQAIAALLPLLNQLVELVEASLPAGTPGATKLKAVEDALSAAYATEQTATVAFSDIWPSLSGIASVLVATFKSTGKFTSAGAAPVAES